MSADESCAAPKGGGALPLAEARGRIVAAVAAPTQRQILAVEAALGRALAGPVQAPIDLPPFDHAAMDGYALRHADLAGSLVVCGTALAGAPFAGAVAAGEAVRIFTGAALPAGADTVVMQEHVGIGEDGRVRVRRSPAKGANIRRRGEDQPAGGVALAAGTLLGAPQIGLLAALGIAEVAVWRRPRVAVLATGDELRGPGEPLAPGQIHESNSRMLCAALVAAGMEAIDCGRVADRTDALVEAISSAAACADAIVTTGGVSAGDADLVTPLLRDVGGLALWKVAMKPGRPLAFGHVAGRPLFALPGNPVAALVTFHQLVQPALERMAGFAARTPLSLPARLLTPLGKKTGRVEFQRGILGHAADGALTVCSAGGQGSAMLASLAASDCYIVLEPDRGPVEVGEMVDVQPYAGFRRACG